jgi:histidine triad (HIT) family protein
MDDCIFCKIVAGDIPGKILYQDDESIAFLDAFPLVEGHTLVIPKAHHEQLQDLPPASAKSWMLAVQHVAANLQTATNADALTIGLHNGKAAGQVVPHVHMHILPRYENDGGGTLHSVIKVEDQQSIDEVFDKLVIAF